MTGQSPTGQVITFYSYKGGTGRSMALANVACLFAQRHEAEEGKPVLAVDWDLEAPGLHRYFEPYVRGAEAPGLIDLFVEARDMVTAADETADRVALAKRVCDAINLGPYVQPTAFPNLHFLRAGRMDAEYASRVNTFPWTEFFAAVPQFFRLFAQRLARDYSFVLIDSRTGVTDMGGICTMLMPEKLVVVFTPNRQSLTGVTALVRRAGEYRRSSDDLRPLVVFPLPSRIDTSFPELMKLWRRGDRRTIPGWEVEFQELLREEYALDDDDVLRLEGYLDGVQLQHVAQYAFGEPIAVVEERATDKLTLANSYATLRDYLLRGAPWASAEPAGDAAELERKVARLEERIRDTAIEPSSPTGAPPSRQFRIPRWWYAVLMLLAFLLAYFGWKAFTDVEAERSSALLARVLQLDPHKTDPSTTALLLLETLPYLKDAEREVAVSRLRRTLATIPRQVFSYKPDELVESMSFSADGRSLLWRGKEVAGRRRLGQWSEADRKVWSWTAFARGAGFADPRGTIVVTHGAGGFDTWRAGVRVSHVEWGISPGGAVMISRDGDYFAWVDENRLIIWKTAAILTGRRDARSVYSGSVRGAVRWLDCVQTAEVCAVTTATTVAVLDVKGGGLIQGMAAGEGTLIRVSRSGRLMGRVDARSILIAGLDPVSPLEIDISKLLVSDFSIPADEKSVVAINIDGTLYRYDLPSGRVIGRSEVVADVPWTDSRIVPMSDGRFVIWDRARVRLLTADLSSVAGRFDGGGEILGIGTNATGDRLAIARRTDNVTVSDIASNQTLPDSGAKLVAATCERVGRILTPEEWATYLSYRPYAPQCRKKAD